MLLLVSPGVVFVDRFLSVWRPLSKVQSWPLALCDARTVDPNDLVTCDIVRRRYVGETYFGKYNPDQQWYYLSDMTPDDIVLVKVYDSDPDVPAKRKSQRGSLGPRLLLFANAWVTGHRMLARLISA